MIVCIPTEGELGLEERIAEQFGHAKTYTLFDTSTNKLRVVPINGNRNNGNGTAPEVLLKESVEAVLTSELGRDLINKLKKEGIWVYTGARGTVWEAIISWRRGKLSRSMP